MKKKTIILIAGCSLVSILTVTILFAISEDKTHRANPFTRIFPPHSFSEDSAINLEQEMDYISGATNHTVYLSNYLSLDLLSLDISSKNLQHAKLKVEKLPKGKLFQLIQVHVDSPDFSMVDGSAPLILKGNLSQLEAKPYMYDSVFFSASAPISMHSFAIRAQKANGEFVLGKVKADTPHVDFNYSLLKKQIDGIFCTDGMIRYDKEMSKLIYSYFYRNQFIVMDTNLHLEYVGKTIDTISTASISVASMHGKKSGQMDAPPLLVNRMIVAYNGLLFVNSQLMGRNEKRESFEGHSPIDVYSLRNGEYRFSFYIENVEGNPFKDFCVMGNKLIALFKKQIKIYNLRSSYFKEAIKTQDLE